MGQREAIARCDYRCEEHVLKITIDETSAERRWILQGRLVEVWVDELRKSWRSKQRRKDQPPCVIDLNNVTFIDKKGERLLRTMSKHGAQFVASGIYIRHVLEQIITHGEPHLSRLLSCLFVGFVATVIYLFAPAASAHALNAGTDNQSLIECYAKPGIETRTIAASYPSSRTQRSELEGALRCKPRL